MKYLSGMSIRPLDTEILLLKINRYSEPKPTPTASSRNRPVNKKKKWFSTLEYRIHLLVFVLHIIIGGELRAKTLSPMQCNSKLIMEIMDK